MPVVWKSYESMVRLVAAIVAAHPDMKLNYAGKHIFFLQSQIHFHDLTAFRFFSPFSFSNSYTHNPDCHIQEIAKYHGGGCTYKAVWGVMTTCKSNGDMLREAFDSGVDPIGIVMKDGSSAKATGRTKSGSTCDFSFSPIFT